MALAYTRLYYDFRHSIEPLTDVERGRLFMAILEYGELGAVPELKGNERFIFPSIRAQIDRDRAEYEKKCQKNKENGNKGGRPITKPNGYFQNPK